MAETIHWVPPGTGGSGGASKATNGFRLTLASGLPVYAPQAFVPTSTDTTGDTVSFSFGHGYATGTIVTVSATIGGLTAGTRYYLNVASSTTVSFHTTLAAALAGTSKVDLTASITQTVIPSGITNTTLYFTPFTSNEIALFDGTSTWPITESNEVSIALGTLTSGLNYDVYAFLSGGALTLELVAWTDDSTRAVSRTRLNGIWVKSGTTTKRYVGTIRTDTTTTTIDDGGGIITQAGGKRFVWNQNNRCRTFLRVIDTTSTWTYTSSTAWRQANGAAGNKIEFVVGDKEDGLEAYAHGEASCTVGTANPSVSLGVSNTTLPHPYASISAINETAGVLSELPARLSYIPNVGYSYIAWLERNGNAAQTSTFYGYDSTNNNRLTGLSVSFMA